MVHPSLYIADTRLMGRGVFTSENIETGKIIEISPVVVMTAAEKQLLDQTLLHDYIFDWGSTGNCCMALGYIAVYNHSYKSNCEYEMDYEKRTMIITTMRAIQAGEELFVNYNGNWDDERKVWFDKS